MIKSNCTHLPFPVLGAQINRAMHTAKVLLSWSCLLGLSAAAACPFGHTAPVQPRQEECPETPNLLEQFEVDDSQGFMTSDVGGPIEEQISLKAGMRGPTLLEDFIFRQKIMHLDHERVSFICPHSRVLQWSPNRCDLARYPSELFTPEVLEHTASSRATVILATSPQLASWAPRERKHQSSCGSLRWPGLAAAQTRPGMSMGLQPGCKWTS